MSQRSTYDNKYTLAFLFDSRCKGERLFPLGALQRGFIFPLRGGLGVNLGKKHITRSLSCLRCVRFQKLAVNGSNILLWGYKVAVLQKQQVHKLANHCTAETVVLPAKGDKACLTGPECLRCVPAALPRSTLRGCVTLAVCVNVYRSTQLQFGVGSCSFGPANDQGRRQKVAQPGARKQAKYCDCIVIISQSEWGNWITRGIEKAKLVVVVKGDKLFTSDSLPKPAMAGSQFKSCAQL